MQLVADTPPVGSLVTPTSTTRIYPAGHVSHMGDKVDPGVPLVVLGEVSGWLRALHPSGEVGWVSALQVRRIGIAR